MTTCCRLLINELLAFLQCKIEVMDEVSLIQICDTNFSESEIDTSKSIVFDALLLKSVSRKGELKKKRCLQDIIKVLKETDPNLLPIFVAKELHRLPPVTFDHVDATSLLKDILLLKQSVAAIKTDYVRESTISEIREELAEVRRDCELLQQSKPLSSKKVSKGKKKQPAKNTVTQQSVYNLEAEVFVKKSDPQRKEFIAPASVQPLSTPAHSDLRLTAIPQRERVVSSTLVDDKFDSSSEDSYKTVIVERAKWGRPLEFILACLGYAVGLGNVWRFPYLCYRNGGGAFLIPFFLMLIFIGLPLFFLELYIGQYTGVGPLQAFSAISPFFSGLGYCTLVVISIISIYYMVIVAWTLFYTIVSLANQLNWGSCDNNYNSDFCYSGSYDQACRVNNTGASTDQTFFQRTCKEIGDICMSNSFSPLNGTHCFNQASNSAIPWYTNVTRVLASEEYYNERVLGRGQATWENWGTIQWHLVGTLFLSWLIAFFCVIKGVQSAGKVVYFTALFPYVMLTALVIRGVTLEGAGQGLIFYLNPQWETLLEPRVWGDAASQIFYSFGVACGSLITLASYNNFYNNCHFDATLVSVANFFTSIYAGFAIFSVLGFQAKMMGVEVSDVAGEGVGLAFVTYPEALLQMPLPQLWSILFFSMLFILGLGSQFAGIEAINTAIVDQWPHLRKNYWRVTAFTCTACFLLGLPMCFSGGVYLFTLLDWNTASWAVLLIGMAECAAVAWSYGINRAMADLATMNMKLNKFLRFYWKSVWTVFVPIGSVAILAFLFSDWSSASYENYVFPLFADLLGWVVGMSTIILFPVGIVWALYHGYRGKSLFTPTVAWNSAVKTEATRSDSIITMNSTHTGPYDNMGYIL